ncbi:unnamed protein product [Amoebophrya sp. A120]|nr:unnamed protein product [Amoebophrya sp. A120]|eukprot:GSA120T00020607001.1
MALDDGAGTTSRPLRGPRPHQSTWLGFSVLGILMYVCRPPSCGLVRRSGTFGAGSIVYRRRRLVAHLQQGAPTSSTLRSDYRSLIFNKQVAPAEQEVQQKLMPRTSSEADRQQPPELPSTDGTTSTTWVMLIGDSNIRGTTLRLLELISPDYVTKCPVFDTDWCIKATPAQLRVCENLGWANSCTAWRRTCLRNTTATTSTGEGNNQGQQVVELQNICGQKVWSDENFYFTGKLAADAVQLGTPTTSSTSTSSSRSTSSISSASLTVSFRFTKSPEALRKKMQHFDEIDYHPASAPTASTDAKMPPRPYATRTPDLVWVTHGLWMSDKYNETTDCASWFRPIVEAFRELEATPDFRRRGGRVVWQTNPFGIEHKGIQARNVDMEYQCQLETIAKHNLLQQEGSGKLPVQTIFGSTMSLWTSWLLGRRSSQQAGPDQQSTAAAAGGGPLKSFALFDSWRMIKDGCLSLWRHNYHYDKTTELLIAITVLRHLLVPQSARQDELLQGRNSAALPRPRLCLPPRIRLLPDEQKYGVVDRFLQQARFADILFHPDPLQWVHNN